MGYRVQVWGLALRFAMAFRVEGLGQGYRVLIPKVRFAVWSLEFKILTNASCLRSCMI